MNLSGYGYICSAGETFDGIALNVYGRERYAAELLNANPALCGKMVFEGGEVLRLPTIDLTVDELTGAPIANTPPWKRA